MKDKIPSPIQLTAFGNTGGMNLIPFTYKISEKPIGDIEKWGVLAHIEPITRQKIMDAGYGEMKMHIEHIKDTGIYIKKMRKKNKNLQLGLEL